MRTPGPRLAPSASTGRPLVPCPNASRDTGFFIGTEVDIDAIRNRAPPISHNHSHAYIRRALASAKRTKHRSLSFESGPSSPFPTPNSQPRETIHDDDDSDLYSEEPDNYGVETIASLTPSEPVHVSDPSGSQTFEPRHPSRHEPHLVQPQASPVLSHFEGMTAYSVLSSSSSLGESLAVTFSDYPLSNDGGDLGGIHQFAPVPHSPRSVRSIRSTPRGDVTEESQFIMPKLAVPTRRHFTVTGKALGRLKVMVVGSKCSGKSSLIQSLAHACEDIVHVDTPRFHNSLIETKASSKPHPRWWSEFDSSLSKSTARLANEELLDRNITFLEAPGFDANIDLQHRETLSAITDYMADMMKSTVPVSTEDISLLRLLGSEEASLITAVLYLVSPAGLTQTDVKLLKLLQSMTNIIPIIPQADLQTPSIVRSDKTATSSFLASADIHPFVFDLQGKGKICPVYAVSTVHDSEPLEMDMDASLLMASGYQPNLAFSDLQRLISDLFSVDGATWLRHSAAKKAVSWWQNRNSQYHPNSLQLRSQTWQVGPRLDSSPFVFRHEHHHHHGRLCYEPWARELQRSLSNTRFPLYQQVLIDIDEEMNNARNTEVGTLIRRDARGEIVCHRAHSNTSDRGYTYRRQRIRTETPAIQQDPLGLLTTFRGLKTTGWSAVQVMSAVGLVGSGFSLGSMR